MKPENVGLYFTNSVEPHIRGNRRTPTMANDNRPAHVRMIFDGHGESIVARQLNRGRRLQPSWRIIFLIVAAGTVLYVSAWTAIAYVKEGRVDPLETQPRESTNGRESRRAVEKNALIVSRRRTGELTIRRTWGRATIPG